VLGIGQAATPTIGMFFGEEDRTAVKDTLKTTLRLGLTINTVLAVVLLAFPAFFVRLLGVKDPGLADMASMAIRLFGIGMPLQLINSVLLNYYQCTKKVGLATMICILQSLVYTVIFAVLLIRPMGATGIWLAFLLGEMMTLLTVGVVLFARTRRFPYSLDTVLQLDEQFGGNPKDRLELSIGNSMEEVMTISSGIYKFGRNRSISKETLNILSLCIEEMAGNVVQHAFKPGEKRWLDLTIVDKPEVVIVRIRDNGSAFDPVAYLSSGAGEGYGILLIQKLADDVEYRRNLGLNNLIIHLRKTQ
jgi:anti-sigma regulatory factor (Ser/Thr protein kinase)